MGGLPVSFIIQKEPIQKSGERMEKKMGTLRKAITIFILYYEEPGYFRVFMVFFAL